MSLRQLVSPQYYDAKRWLLAAGRVLQTGLLPAACLPEMATRSLLQDMVLRPLLTLFHHYHKTFFIFDHRTAHLLSLLHTLTSQSSVMPPKKAGAGKPQYVYVIQDEDYFDPNETDISLMDAKRTNLYQVHADVDTANEMAKAHFENLFKEYASASQEDVDEDDQTITIRWESEISYAEVTVTKMDLFGGTVKSSKKATANKAASKPKSKDTVSVSGESEDELEHDNYTMVKPSTIAKSATQAGSKRNQTLADMDEHEHDDHDLSPETPRQLADVEHHVSCYDRVSSMLGVDCSP